MAIAPEAWSGAMNDFTTEYRFSLEKSVRGLALFARPARRGGIAAGRRWSAFKK